jgi:hypothetical protein
MHDVKMISEAEARLMTHEEVCTQRYAAIEKSFESGSKRMTRIEYLLYIVIGAVLLGPGFAGELVKKILGL